MKPCITAQELIDQLSRLTDEQKRLPLMLHDSDESILVACSGVNVDDPWITDANCYDCDSKKHLVIQSGE